MCCDEERTGIKMEWCGTLYRARFSAAAAARAVKILIIFAVLLVMAEEVCTERMPAQAERTAELAPAAGTAAGKVGTARPKTADLTWILMSAPDMSDVNKAESAVTANVNAPGADETVYQESAEKENVYPIIMAEDMSSGTEESIISGGAEHAAGPDDGTDIYMEEVSDPVPESSSDVSVTGVVNGFLVNESGVIYGIADPDLVVTDGYIELPSEGCSGIASGVFEEGFYDAREIRIPSNITYIEEGAFTGLANVEWYEMELSGEYYTEEGVLFSKNGSCILAFPSGRTGTYKVPSCVERFAAGAFENAQLKAVDATACSLADTSGIPENITLLVRETP